MEPVNLTQLLDDYRRASDRWSLAPMRLEQLSRKRRVLADWQTAMQALADFGPTGGWLQFQSAVVTFHHAAMPAAVLEHGSLLEAEVARDDASLHVRRDGFGSWIAVEFAESETDGEPCLAEEVQLLGAGDAPGNLRYIRYWQPDPVQGTRQLCARFAGFLAREA